MKTIRRLYFYAVSVISLEVVVWGIISLLRSILVAKQVISNASLLAQALSLILVGVPIFLVHWLWAQNVSSKDEEEKSASLRAIFLYGVLLGTFIPAVQNFLAFFNRTFLSAANLYTERAIVGGSQTWVDNLIAIVINLLIAAYFLRVVNHEWKTLSNTGNYAEIRRLYRFIWMLYGLIMVIYGAQQALSYAFTLSINNVLGDMGRETAVNAIALLLTGSPIWYFSWRVLQDALPYPDEKESLLRLGILYLLALVGVTTVLAAGFSMLYTVLIQIFGENKASAEFVQSLGESISFGVPFAILWAYYGKWLNQQFAFEEVETRRAGKKRLYFYILSLIGVGVFFFGAQSLISVVIDLATDRSYLSIGGFRSPLASALSGLFIGLPLWLMTWLPMQREATHEGAVGDHARRSLIRKSYLYLVIFASVIGIMVSAGILLFTIINSVLGGEAGNIANTILNTLQTLLLFVLLLLYHLFVLRKDGLTYANVLESKQSEFGVLVLDSGDGKFAESIKAVFTKNASKIPVTVLNVNEPIPADAQANAVILPGSLATGAQENVSAWIKSFNGNRLIVTDEAAGTHWVDDAEGAVESARALAEGQELRPLSSKRTTSVWTYVAYVFAVLFACQLLFGLLMFGVSMVTSF
jgi:hypothetical protein